MNEDSELLCRYVDGSESAFADLVQRHINLVYSAALRRMGGDRSGAEEVTQLVFTRCARKATSLRGHPALSAWLYRCTAYAATTALRTRFRRQRLEQRMLMEPDLVSPAERDAIWAEIRPVIDLALDRLPENDRRAVVLRFFEGRSLAEIGAALRISDDAARMRVDRALGKLQSTLARRGITSTAAALGSALAANGIVAAPTGLGTAIAAAAGATASVGVATLGSIFVMTKFHVSLVGAVLALGIGGVLVESHALHRANDAIDAGRRELREHAGASVASADAASTANTSSVELTELRRRIARLKQLPDGVTDADLIPRSAWKDAGRATPEAAFETFTWATTHHAYEVLAQTVTFSDRSATDANAFFAALPADIQKRFGTWERLFVPFIFAPEPNHPAQREVEAIEPIETIVGVNPDEVLIRSWLQYRDGTGRVETVPARQVGSEWRIGSRAWGFAVPHSAEFARAIIAGRQPETLVDMR